MKLAAVVVTYNRLAQLEVTLARLLGEDVDHVLVVDNASTDGTADWLAGQTDPRLEVVHLPQNTGGAGGFEAGVRHLRAGPDPDWIALMDDDARPLPGAMARFRTEAPAGASNIGVIAAAVLNPDGSICEMNRPSLNPFWHGKVLLQTLFKLTAGDKRGFHIGDAAFDADAGPSDIDVASFVGYFLSRQAVAAIGPPDGGYFIYGDDVTYSLRLRRAGLRIVMHPGVRFEHDCGTLSIDLATRPLWKVYYLSRNGVPMTWHAARWLAPVALAYYTVQWARKARHYDSTERPVYRRLMWRGLWHGLCRRKGRYDPAHVLADQAKSG